MDFTQIITTLIVAAFSGTGLLAVLANNRAAKKNNQTEMLNDIKKSIDELAELRSTDQARIEGLVKKINAVDKRVNALTASLGELTTRSIQVDKALIQTLDAILDALKRGHINGEGEVAHKILEEAAASLDEYQEHLIAQQFEIVKEA